jgi:hypothetical protein
MTDGLFLFGSDQTAEVPSSPGTANHATAKAPLGALYRENGKIWRYVKFDAQGVAAVAIGVVHWYALDPANGVFTVTTDMSDGIGKNLVAGVLGCVVTDGYYTWIQVGGVASALIDFTVLPGDYVAGAVPGIKMKYSATDKKFAAVAPTTGADAMVFGVMIELGSVTDSYGKVLLQNLDW